MKPKVSLIVTDMDNTLFDWVHMWYTAFSALLDQLVKSSGIPQSVLESEIQSVFQKHGTTEYSFLIEEIPSLVSKHPGEDLNTIYVDAIDAYRSARRSTLMLYPGVLETMHQLKLIGCKIVAFTESMEFYSMIRIKKLGLDGLLNYVYSPPDHFTPRNIKRYYDDDYYKLASTSHRFLEEGEKKPNPKLLLDIINDQDINGQREQTIYIGDSLMKDITMAQDAGVIDVYAKYGVAQNTEAYELLRRVTHWTQEDVDREKMILRNRAVKPTYVLEKSFGQILEYFDFIPHFTS